MLTNAWLAKVPIYRSFPMDKKMLKVKREVEAVHENFVDSTINTAELHP